MVIGVFGAGGRRIRGWSSPGRRALTSLGPTPESDHIEGRGGDDTIVGQGDDDDLFGQAGDDNIEGDGDS